MIFTMTTGEYSDFSIQGVFRALEEIDCDALLKKWDADHPPPVQRWGCRQRSRADIGGFLRSIAHMMELIPSWELWTDEYTGRVVVFWEDGE
jgi:hypothetical protein